MSTPLGHALGAATLYQAGAGWLPESLRGWKGTAAAVLVALIPDLDAAVYAAARWAFGAPHRGFSHSILFCSLLGCAWFLALRAWRFEKWYAVLALLLAVSNLHLFLDWAMKCGPDIKLFAPFSGRGFNSPIQLAPTAYYSTKSVLHLIGMIFYPKNLLAFGLEIMTFAPLLLAIFYSRNDRSTDAGRAAAWPIAIFVSGAAVLLTIIIYN